MFQFFEIVISGSEKTQTKIYLLINLKFKNMILVKTKNRQIFVNPIGLITAEIFQSKEEQKIFVRLDYGKYKPNGEKDSTLIGEFESIETANNEIKNLLN